MVVPAAQEPLYVALMALSFYVFVVHSLTARDPFLNPRLLRDRNFTIGIVIVVLFGMLNFTPITLLPTLLQDLQGYPDSIIGLVLSARGIGTFAGFVFMVFASRLDPRIPMATGFLLQAWAGWVMVGFDINVPLWSVVRTWIVPCQTMVLNKRTGRWEIRRGQQRVCRWAPVGQNGNIVVSDCK